MGSWCACENAPFRHSTGHRNHAQLTPSFREEIPTLGAHIVKAGMGGGWRHCELPAAVGRGPSAWKQKRWLDNKARPGEYWEYDSSTWHWSLAYGKSHFSGILARIKIAVDPCSCHFGVFKTHPTASASSTLPTNRNFGDWLTSSKTSL